MLMQIARLLQLALSCCIALINQMFYLGQPFNLRAGGWGGCHHPNIGGYVDRTAAIALAYRWLEANYNSAPGDAGY